MMAVTVKNIIPAKRAENSQTTQYTSPTATKTIIDKFTATNTTSGAVTLSINLIPASGSPSSSNLVMSLKAIAAGENYTCLEVVGQVLEAGGFISTIAGASNSLNIISSGREIT